MEKKKKSKKLIIILIIVAVLIAFIAIIGVACSNYMSKVQEQMADMMGGGDDLFVVERQDVEQEITTSGNTLGLESKVYVSPVSAKVDSIKVEVGQAVGKGDVLLTYDASDLGDNLEKVKIEAQSQRAAGNESFEMANKAAGKASEANAKAEDLEDEIKQLKKDITKLSALVDKYESKMKKAVVAPTTEAKKETSEEDAEHEENEEESVSVQQQVATVTTGSGTGLSKEEEKAYKKAVSDLKKKTESLAEKQESLAEQKSIAQANSDVTVSESARVQANAQNQLAEMSIQDAQDSLDAAQAGIVAKKNGIVSSIDVYEGGVATESSPVITVIDGDKIGVEFAVSKDDLSSITNGQKARVVVAGNEYDGTVEFVSRIASSDVMATNNAQSGGTIKGRILISNPDDNIFIGVSAKVYIFVGKAEKALVIPYESLCTDKDGDYVYVVNDENLIERKDVTIGLYSDEYYEVVDGITEGDKVIRNVTSDMKPGDPYMGALAGMPGAQ